MGAGGQSNILHKDEDPAYEHNWRPCHGRWDEGIEGKWEKTLRDMRG
jgi:hypothetical protein